MSNFGQKVVIPIPRFGDVCFRECLCSYVILRDGSRKRNGHKCIYCQIYGLDDLPK